MFALLLAFGFLAFELSVETKQASPVGLPSLPLWLKNASNNNLASTMKNSKTLQVDSGPVHMITAQLRACSHVPGTVNYPGARVTSHSHDDVLSLGNVAACGNS